MNMNTAIWVMAYLALSAASYDRGDFSSAIVFVILATLAPKAST